VSGRITQLGDSSLTLDNTYRVNTGRISKVYKKRSWWFHSWKTFFVASFAYTAGSVINHAVKSDDLWDNTMLPVSGVLAGGGALSLAMRYRDLEIGEKWRIRIIDLDHPVLP
jgi:hypothetical protein